MKTAKQWIAAAMAAALAVTAVSCSAIKKEEAQGTAASAETLTETPATVPGAAETAALSETTAAVPETAATAALSAAQGTAGTAPPAGATAAVSAAASSATASPLTLTQIKELLLTASDFYGTWIVAGPPLDYSGDYKSREITVDGKIYLPSLRQDFTTVEQIGAVAETLFSEEFRATEYHFKDDYWADLYLTVDGTLYAFYTSGQGGDAMPDAYSIEIVSADENYCRFNLLSTFYDGVRRDPSELTHTFTIIKERGYWVFTDDFPYILNQDASWDC